MRYLAMDIGCLECGEPSKVLGVFDDVQDAAALCGEWEKVGWRGGQHIYHVFELPLPNIPFIPSDEERRDDA
jgi:hypothetical protein